MLKPYTVVVLSHAEFEYLHALLQHDYNHALDKKEDLDDEVISTVYDLFEVDVSDTTTRL